MSRGKSTVRPRVLFLVDSPNWAFDFAARSIAARLSDSFDFSIRYRFVDTPEDRAKEKPDLVYMFFWGDPCYKDVDIGADRIIKEVASFRWKLEARFGRISETEFGERYLGDCRLVTTPSRELFEVLRPLRDNVFLCPKGVEPDLFRYVRKFHERMRIGWVGNPDDECKGLKDILIPACEGRYDFRYSSGKWSRSRVARFYRDIDVLAIASTAESQPRPLIESMACGCFPVATDVGLVAELVRSGYNGLIVERSIEAFQKAFAWCEQNLDRIRSIGPFNAALADQAHSWDRCVGRYAELFEFALGGPPGGSLSLPSATLARPRLADSLRDAVSVEEFDELRLVVGLPPRRRFVEFWAWVWRGRDLWAATVKIRRPRFLVRRWLPLSLRRRLKTLRGKDGGSAG